MCYRNNNTPIEPPPARSLFSPLLPPPYAVTPPLIIILYVPLLSRHRNSSRGGGGRVFKATVAGTAISERIRRGWTCVDGDKDVLSLLRGRLSELFADLAADLRSDHEFRQTKTISCVEGGEH